MESGQGCSLIVSSVVFPLAAPYTYGAMIESDGLYYNPHDDDGNPRNGFRIGWTLEGGNWDSRTEDPADPRHTGWTRAVREGRLHHPNVPDQDLVPLLNLGLEDQVILSRPDPPMDPDAALFEVQFAQLLKELPVADEPDVERGSN